MTKGMQSGDGSPLGNIWEEICVQVQDEYSFMWDAYLDLITSTIRAEIMGLDTPTKQALWLQTDESAEWESENENEETPVYDEGDNTS